MTKSRVVGWVAATLVLSGCQYMVVVHNFPGAQFECARRDWAGVCFSPVRLPRPVAGALWDSAPLVLAPTRNLAIAAIGDNGTRWRLDRGWRGLVGRLVFPFSPPTMTETQDEAFWRLSRSNLQKNALWFASLNSVVWVVCFACALLLLRKYREWKASGRRNGDRSEKDVECAVQST